VSDRTFLLHLGGKIEITPKVPVKTRDDISMVYTPGVSRISQSIADDPQDVFSLTIKKNTVAVVTDGSEVLGLGAAGPLAALPVMEGKALLFKEFAGVDAFPICLDTQNIDDIVTTIHAIAPTFGAIHLEDLSSPRCFEIERRLGEALDIPAMHNDQHGTAIVVLAALINALKITGKAVQVLRVVINSAGAAGGCYSASFEDLRRARHHRVRCRRNSPCRTRVLGQHAGRKRDSRSGTTSNPRDVRGTLQEACMRRCLHRLWRLAPYAPAGRHPQAMGEGPIVFRDGEPRTGNHTGLDPACVRALSATGKSDYPDQINSMLCFPAFFRLACSMLGPKAL
jgi:malate dehydrogenase (oxaloacetate-decarboxylating)